MTRAINRPEEVGEQRTAKIDRVNDRLNRIPEDKRVISWQVGIVTRQRILKTLPDFAIMDEIDALDRDLRKLCR